MFNTLFSKKKTTSNSEKLNILENKLNLLIGINESGNYVYLNEKSLYQNILITGTIGTGKTSSAMYPFTRQLIEFNFFNPHLKIGMLILDVKGNYHLEVYNYAKKFNRLNDLIVIELNGKYTYNPLNKPNLKASVLANRLKTILLLFSKNNTESYWLDKAEQVLTEAIKLCRLYNNSYVTFKELHNLVTSQKYYKTKINLLRNKFLSKDYSSEDTYNLLSSITFLKKNIGHWILELFQY